MLEVSCTVEHNHQTFIPFPNSWGGIRKWKSGYQDMASIKSSKGAQGHLFNLVDEILILQSPGSKSILI